MEWAGKAEFNAQDLQPWIVDGEQAGLYKSSGRFTFAIVEGKISLILAKFFLR